MYKAFRKWIFGNISALCDFVAGKKKTQYANFKK